VSDDTSCQWAALGLWGFDVGGTKTAGEWAARVVGASAHLPARLPWHTTAHFVALNPAFKPIYTRGSDVVVAERALGQGSLVLLAEGFLLSNQAQRETRFPELLLWLIGSSERIAFEESHLGVSERRGVMSLLRELRLHGFVLGCCVVALLFAWQRWRPLSQGSAPRDAAASVAASVADTTLLTLLRRCMTPRQAMQACQNEARAAQIARIVRQLPSDQQFLSPADFNRIFCKQREESNNK